MTESAPRSEQEALSRFFEKLAEASKSGVDVLEALTRLRDRACETVRLDFQDGDAQLDYNIVRGAIEQLMRDVMKSGWPASAHWSSTAPAGRLVLLQTTSESGRALRSPCRGVASPDREDAGRDFREQAGLGVRRSC